MKQLIFTILILLGGLHSFGQQVVTDPILTKLATEEAVDRQIIKVNTLKELDQSITQTQKLIESYELARETYDALSEVNKYIKELSRLQYALERQASLLKRSKKMISDYEKSDVFSISEYNRINRHIKELIKNCNKIIEMFDVLLTPGKSKMSDADRMELMLSLEKELGEKQTMTEASLDYYEDVQNQREALRSLNQMGEIMY